MSKTSPKANKKDTEKKPSKAPAKEASKKAAIQEEEIPQTQLADADELEEQEEAAEAAGHSSNSNAAALAAAAGGNTEMSASFKNFRHHPDMENFYRFIYENDLRHEALAIIDEIM